jgi:MFS family permease
VNIIAVGVGASIGWASPSLPLLQSDESILSEPLTSGEASWVGSLLALGALFGTLLFGWLSETIGRFWATLLTTIPQIVSWIIEWTIDEKLKDSRLLDSLNSLTT